MMYTDAIQVVIMMGGAVTLAILSECYVRPSARPIVSKCTGLAVNFQCHDMNLIPSDFFTGFVKVGGLAALKSKYMIAVASHVSTESLYTNASRLNSSTIDNSSLSQCGLPRQDAWHLFRDPLHADYPSVAVFLRMSIGAVFYWCAHQTIVQRTLASKNISHSKGGALLAGVLKLTPMFLMVMPGMISRVLYPGMNR